MRGLLILVNFNQELEIGRFLDSLGQSPCGLDTVLVDDGSSDDSPSIAESKGFQVLRHGANLGVGAAIRTGIRHAIDQQRFEFVVIMSSNGKMRPGDLATVVGPIQGGEADYVQGSRFAHGGSVLAISNFRRLAIPVYSIVSSVLLKRRFTDITCGFRAYKLSFLSDSAVDLNQDWLDEYEAELYIHYQACRLGLRMVEVPVTIDYSHLAPGRASKMKPVAGWWSLLRPFLLLSLGVKH